MLLFLNLSLFYICLSKEKPYRAYVVLLYNIRQKIKFLCLCLSMSMFDNNGKKLQNFHLPNYAVCRLKCHQALAWY